MCSRLGLTSLAYLWQRDQKELLKEMIDCQLNAVLVKVAAAGLNRKHLGQSLAQMEPILLGLESKFGLHVCGEGGEYETITLDCPLFKKRLVITESRVHVHSDDMFAPVLFLEIEKMELVNKSRLDVKVPAPRWLESDPVSFVQDDNTTLNLSDKDTNNPSLVDESNKMNALMSQQPIKKSVKMAKKQTKDYLVVSGLCIAHTPLVDQKVSLEEETKAVMKSLIGKRVDIDHLSESGLTLNDVVQMTLYVADMNAFGELNKAYGSFLGLNPPTRVTVETNLIVGRIQIDCQAYMKQRKETLHVQSISYWAYSELI